MEHTLFFSSTIPTLQSKCQALSASCTVYAPPDIPSPFPFPNSQHSNHIQLRTTIPRSNTTASMQYIPSSEYPRDIPDKETTRLCGYSTPVHLRPLTPKAMGSEQIAPLESCSKVFLLQDRDSLQPFFSIPAAETPSFCLSKIYRSWNLRPRKP